MQPGKEVEEGVGCGVPGPGFSKLLWGAPSRRQDAITGSEARRGICLCAVSPPPAARLGRAKLSSAWQLWGC